jgi:predicted phosphoribosyltransferase
MLDYPSEVFRDRREAGHRLGEHLAREDRSDAIVLGLARGGVIVGEAVADRLNAELDVMVVRKLGAPSSKELAIGAVTETGGIYIDDEAVRLTGAGRDYLEQEIKRQREAAYVRKARYREDKPAPLLKDRNVILVDDGLATGASMIAAGRSARSQEARKLTIAVPVGAPGSCQEMDPEADEVVCLRQPLLFGAVGRFYEDFSEVSDEEVEQILASADGRTVHRGNRP